MNQLQRWEHAQRVASSPSDWAAVDQLAIELSKGGLNNLGDINEAVRLALLRLGSSNGQNIDEGSPSEVWIEHLLRAVWRSLSNIERIKTVFFELPFPCHSVGTDNRILAVSKLWCSTLGYDPEEVIGRKSVEFLTEESRQRAIEYYLPRFWREGSISKAEYVMLHKSGRKIPVYLSGCAEFDSDGNPIRSIAIISLKN